AGNVRVRRARRNEKFCAAFHAPRRKTVAACPAKPEEYPRHRLARMSSIHYVIGSGPAGVACARALLQRGATVRMLDAGIQLESDRAEVVAQLRAAPPASWRPEQLAVIKENMTATGKGIP